MSDNEGRMSSKDDYPLWILDWSYGESGRLVYDASRPKHHRRNCSGGYPYDRACTCALQERQGAWDIATNLVTERTMHAAWRKRAEEAEAAAMRLAAALGRANRALDEIIALDEKGPAWEPYDVFGDPSDIDISNSGEHRLHGAWTAFQYAAKIARAARTQPEGSNG